MSRTDPLPVTEQQVASIVGEVWDAYLGLRVEAAPAGPAPGEPAMTGRVGISGAWQGSVELRCTTEHATAAAEAMFAAEPGTLEPAEVADAMGELTNVVGGTIKSLLPEPSSLSIPLVSDGTSAPQPAAHPVLEVGLRCGAAPVLVTVWRA